MNITIKGLTKEKFNSLLSGLDIIPGDGFTTGKETTYGTTEESTLFSLSILPESSAEFSFVFTNNGVNIRRYGVIPSYFLSQESFDHIFIQ